MSWIPAYKIGLWNAWLLMLVIPLHPLIMKWIDQSVGSGDLFKKMGGDSSGGKPGVRDRALNMLIMYILPIYSIFLPLKAGTAWLWAGLGIYLAGLAIFLTALIQAAATPPGQPFIKGIYQFSRNPLYLAFVLIFTGTGIASASWVFVLLSGVMMGTYNSLAISEERRCLELFGEVFREYMNRTPRWIGIPKLK